MKKLIALLLALAMIASMLACGGQPAAPAADAPAAEAPAADAPAAPSTSSAAGNGPACGERAKTSMARINGAARARDTGRAVRTSESGPGDAAQL